MTAVSAFERESLVLNLTFLAYRYCQKQLKMKTLAKKGTVLILKSVLQERCT